MFAMGHLRPLFVTFACTLFLTSPSLRAEMVAKGRVGGTVELDCTLNSTSDRVMTPNLFPLHVVEWVRLGYNVPILIQFGDYTPRVHPNYKGRVSLARGASLVVDGLMLEDEGWFECRILLLNRTADEFRNGTWTFLSITAPPVFVKVPPSFVEVLLGESLALGCSAFGNPKPTVTWQNVNSTVEDKDNIEVINGTLLIVRVTRESAGMYECLISNSEGHLTHVTQLQVKGPPVIVISPEDTTLNMSQDAVLKCHADAYPSNLTYEWQKEEQNVYNVESLRSRVKILVDGALLISELIPEDAGNYTCVPSNGLFNPPSASAYLKVNYAARVLHMPKETYLPAGMHGTIMCPVQAEPPMTTVSWTKDGASLDLHQYPGWIINPEGSLFIATVNDNAVGLYACTAYNSYGTMGQSETTKVILKDPPLFQLFPMAEYIQEVGRKLIIPCQAHGDPAPNITWSKVGSTPCSLFTILSNGSLVLYPLTKSHHGAWECHASNSVGKVSKSTKVVVSGTSPHAVTAVYISPSINSATVSWKPGFDGGYSQRFSIWVKPTYRGKHEWTSLQVPTSVLSFLVTGLQPATSYQVSILPQNKLGSGPFSEIFTVLTLASAPSTDPPTEITDLAAPRAPTALSVNYTAVGVLLKWLPPPQSQLITAFMLQARQEMGEWVTLDREISVNAAEILVQGLTRDSWYELRLLSHGARMLSDPSESVSINTKGMDIYPTPPSLLTFTTQPLMAGVIAGMCFLFVAIILSVVAACVMNHRREQRNRKSRADISAALQRNCSPRASNASSNSLLKIKLCPALSLCSKSPFFDCSNRSSFDKDCPMECQDQKKQLLPSSSPPPCYTLFESHLGSSPFPWSAIESISRGPDGRFITQSNLDDSVEIQIKDKKESPLSTGQDNGGESRGRSIQGSPGSCSIKAGQNVKEEPPLTGMDKQNTCLTLVKEHKDLKSFIHSHRAQNYEKEQQQSDSESTIKKWSVGEKEEPISKFQNIPLRQKAQRTNSLAQRVSEHRKGCYFGSTSSPMDRPLTSTSQYIQWDISPVTSSTRQMPVLNLSEEKTYCMLPETEHTGSELEDSAAAEDLSCSSVTQYTRLLTLSHQRASDSSYESDTSNTKARCPVRTTKRELLPDKHWIKKGEINTQANSPCSFQDPEAFERTQHTKGKGDSQDDHLPKLITNPSQSVTDCFSVSYDNPKNNSENKTKGNPSSLSLQSEIEKESVRARSRKSDKCVFSISSNNISPLPLLKNDEIDQSNSSSRLSQLLKVKSVPEAAMMSPPQPSTILEYLSLPGFVEMSVDEPTEESQMSESSWHSTKQVEEPFLTSEPDVVFKHCENKGDGHLEESNGYQSRCLVNTKMPITPVGGSKPKNETSSKPCQEWVQENSNINETWLKTKFSSSQYLAPEGRRQSFMSYKSQSSDNPTGPNPAQPLVRTKVIYKNEEESEHIQWCQAQNRRTSQVSAQISQAPVPFMKKSISNGPCRTFSGMGQPRPQLRKSVSSVSQVWNHHHQNIRAYVSNNCYDYESSAPVSVKDNSYNLRFTLANSFSRSSPSWQGTEGTESYSIYGLQRPCYNERPYMYGQGPSKPVNPYKSKADPRRQAAVIPESLSYPVSYQESLRLAQHKYVPHCPPRPISVPRLITSWDHPCFVNSRRGFQRPLFPRRCSGPSPHQATYPSGEMQKEMVDMGEGRDNRGDGGRASYASQSSGRGSVGPFGHLRQSLSITPTLLSSPETTEETERQNRERDLQKTKSRNTSVDECYEFDATEFRIGLDHREGLRIKQEGMRPRRDCKHDKQLTSSSLLQDKDPNSIVSFPSVSLPPQQSLSEARFNALMQEFQEYRSARESPSQVPGPLPDLQCESALL